MQLAAPLEWLAEELLVVDTAGPNPATWPVLKAYSLQARTAVSGLRRPRWAVSHSCVSRCARPAARVWPRGFTVSVRAAGFGADGSAASKGEANVRGRLARGHCC